MKSSSTQAAISFWRCSTIEVKINREILDYKETVFFGLTLRQSICSILACGAAVGIYFALHKRLGLEITSWLCIAGAAPFGAAGFVTHNGLNLEQLAAAWFRFRFLTPKHLSLRCKNALYDDLPSPLDRKGGKVNEKKS